MSPFRHSSARVGRGVIVVALSVFGLVWSVGPARAETVVFEDTFDAEPTGQQISSLANWTVTGNVDVDPLSWGFDPYPGNGHYIDLDGSNSCASSIIETAPIALGPGTYRLSFELGSNTYGGGADNALFVQLGSLYTETFDPSPEDYDPGTVQLDLTPVSRLIAVGTATTATLLFQETDPTPDCGGSMLDDVVLAFIGGQDTSAATSYTVFGTPDADTISISDGPVVDGSQTVEVTVGTDTWDLANKTSIFVNGGDGSDTITVDNPTAADGVSSIAANGEGDDDAAHVVATAAGIAYTVDTGAGAGDTVEVGSTLNGIAGDLDVRDSSDGASATLDDSADTEHNVATLGFASPTTTLSGASPADIDLTGMGAITVLMGSSGDTLRVVGSDPAVSYDVDLGGGKDTFGLKGSATISGAIVDGGAGTDTLKYLQYGTGVTVDLSLGTATGTPGVTGFENIIGSNFHDSLTGSDGANSIQGSAGGDDIFGLGGADTIEGTSLADTISGGDENDRISGKAGDDHLSGDAGDDGIGAGPGADTVDGGDGNDVLKVKDGVSGNDSADGGIGTDTCTADPGDTVVNCEA